MSMELTGEQLLPLPRERVWAALNDPNVLRQCVPGCESFESIADNIYKVAMSASVGPVKARFTGKMTLTDIEQPSSYALTFDGSGGTAGFGKGSARVQLESEGAATRLRYAVKAQVGGRLAQVGARLIDGVARKMAEEFFRRFHGAVMPAVAADAAAVTAADAPAVATASAGARVAWYAVGVLALLGIVYLFLH